MSVHEGLQVAYNDAPEESSEGKIGTIVPDSQAYISNGKGRGNENTHRKNLLCGIRRRNFWIFAILLLMIIAGAIGGGVGAVSHSKSEKHTTIISTVQIASATSSSSGGPISSPVSTNLSTSPTSTASPTALLSGSTSSSDGMPFPTNGILPLDCPALDHDNVTVSVQSSTSKYEIFCGDDYGAKTPSGAKNDLQVTQSLTLNKCLSDCTSYNQDRVRNTVHCQGVSFSANLTYSIQEFGKGGNCFLKQDISGLRLFTDHFLQVSGKLLN